MRSIDSQRASLAKPRGRQFQTQNIWENPGVTEKYQGVWMASTVGGRRTVAKDEMREMSKDQTVQGFLDKSNGVRLFS